MPVLPLTRSTSSGEPPMRLGELLGVLLGIGGRQVDLVQHRDDLEVVLEGEVEVREGLRLDALRGVDEQDRALAGGERAATPRSVKSTWPGVSIMFSAYVVPSEPATACARPGS